jgi:hypothetical protein
MTISISVSKKWLTFALLALLILGGAALVLAFQGDFASDVVQVCVESSGKIRAVDDASECKGNEISGAVVSGAGFQNLSAKISALEGADSNIQAQISALQASVAAEQAARMAAVSVLDARISGVEQLEPLVRLLHANSAARIDIAAVDSTGSPLTGIKYRFGVCTLAESQAGTCTRFLETTLTGTIDGMVISFTDASDPDFAQIVELLTNGVDDVLTFEHEFTPSGGGGGTADSESEFFKDFIAPGEVDLAGFDIDQISLAVDFFILIRSGSGINSFSLDGRLFFELAD